MTLKDRILCSFPDCREYGSRMQCYSTIRLRNGCEKCRHYTPANQLEKGFDTEEDVLKAFGSTGDLCR